MACPPVGHLPADLFTSRDVFATVLRDGWHMLSQSKRQELMQKFLPESLDQGEQEQSVRMLLEEDLTKFDVSPLDSLFVQLKISRLAPDINKTLDDVKRLRLKAQKLKEKENQIILWKEVLSRRKQLLIHSISCSPDESFGTRIRLKRKSLSALTHDEYGGCDNEDDVHVHTQCMRITKRISRAADRRYKQELKQLNSLTVITSDDDEDLSFDDGKHHYDQDMGIEFHHFQKALNHETSDDTNELRYKKLLSDYKRKIRHRRQKKENGVKSQIPNSGDKRDNRQDCEQLKAIISRVSGAAEDMILLASPPISPAGGKKAKKRQPVDAVKKKSASKAAAKVIKKEVLSPVPESKPLLPGIELMSRKLDLNLSLKKETVDVFDFTDDSPSESLAPAAAPVPPAVSTTTATAAAATSASASKTQFDALPIASQPQVQHLPQTQLSAIPNPVLKPQPTVAVANNLLLQPTIMSNHISPEIQPSIKIRSPIQATAQSSHVQPSVTMQPPAPAAQLQTYLQNGQSVTPVLPPAHSQSETITQPVLTSNVKLKTPPPVVYEDPPASFFSLIRDVFKSYSQPDLKLTLHKLEELVKDRLRCINPSLGWNHETVQSAMNFLSYFTDPNTEVDAIPLVDYKEKNQQWQWIGQGRDSDDVLSLMCKEWLNEKDRNSSVIDPSQPIPPAAHPTEWTVKPATDDERKEYREQEAVRYNNPNKAFTYRVHSYDSVVGPVKGCGVGVTVTAAPAASPNKAREHSLLVNDRPPFVTLLSLVRDAAARLPNGEGTRADICLLLKDSQYLLSSVSDQQINSIVSGALDRLHYEKDPCVKYDVNRKVWIYLHRNRSEGDFERLHEMQIAAAKAKKNLSKTQRKPSRPSQTSPPACPKQIQQKKPLFIVDNAVVSPITSSGQTRISISPLIQATNVSGDANDKTKTILNILNQAQGTGTPVPAKKKLVKEVQVVHNVDTGMDDPGVTSTIASVVRPVTMNNVMSMVPVTSVQIANRPIASADSKNKQFGQSQVLTNGLQKLSSKSITVLPARSQPVAALANDENKRTVTLGLPVTHSKVQQPIIRQMPNQQITAQLTQPITGQQTISIQPAGQGAQITVPSSMFFGAKHGGKSYMMTSQNGHQLVLQPQVSGAMTAGQASIVNSGQQQVRLQGIKVISVPSNGPRVLGLPAQGQQMQQMVTRILTRPGLPSLQPVILTQAAGAATQAQVVHQLPSQHQQLISIQSQAQPIISKQVAQPHPQ